MIRRGPKHEKWLNLDEEGDGLAQCDFLSKTTKKIVTFFLILYLKIGPDITVDLAPAGYKYIFFPAAGLWSSCVSSEICSGNMPNVNNQKKLLVDERSIFLSEKHPTPLLLLLPFLQSVVFGRLAAVQLLLKNPLQLRLLFSPWATLKTSSIC